MQHTTMALSGIGAERAGMDFGAQMKRLADFDRREAALRRELAAALATVEVAEREVERLHGTLVRREAEIAALQQEAGAIARLSRELQQVRQVVEMQKIQIAALTS